MTVLDNVLDVKLFGTLFCGGGGPAADDGGFEPCPLPESDSVAIQDTEEFGFAAVGVDNYRSVCEDAVHVHSEQLDFGKTIHFAYLPHNLNRQNILDIDKAHGFVGLIDYG